MRLAVFLPLLLISALSWAGGEVPWPKEDQQNIALRELGGMWVSQHLDAPQRLFYFNIERGGISEACPFVMRTFEVDADTKVVRTAGGGVFCTDQLDAITIVMYDFEGIAQNYLKLVGLKMPAQGSFNGTQMLGITLTTFESDPRIIFQDTFYMTED